MSLHGLENDIIRARFHDARLHAAIVCASASCPSLAADAYRPARYATTARRGQSPSRRAAAAAEGRMLR